MKWLLLPFTALWVAQASAQLEVLGEPAMQAVWPGPQQVRAFFRNPHERTVETELHIRLFQRSSATVAPFGDARSWKRLTVLPGQTIVESTAVTFPDVRAATDFELRWLTTEGTQVGRTVVIVYPSNALHGLNALAGENGLGVLDLHEQLLPWLERAQIPFTNLAEGERLTTFRGRLAILGPFTTSDSLLRYRERALALRQAGTAVVLIAPATGRGQHTSSATFVASRGLVLMAPETLGSLASDPLAQQRLLQSARLALGKDWLSSEPEN